MPMNPRLLRPLASGAFSPKQISGLAVWLDAADDSTVTLNGSTVSEWRDKSGNQRHFAQSSATAQPAYIAGVQNGRSAVRSASNDYLRREAGGSVLSENLSYLGETTHTIFIAWNPAAMAATNYLFYAQNPSSSSTQRLQLTGPIATGGAGYYVIDSGSVANGRLTTSGSSNTVAAPHIVAFRRDGEDFASWGSGADTGTATRASAPAIDYSGTFGLFTNVAADGSGQYYAAGDMYEVLCYDRALTTTERQKIEGWLAWRWGLQAQLPYDHPYAKSFPGFGSQATPTDADTLTYLAAVKAADGTGVEVGVANAVDAFVTGCKSDGIWGAIKASCILAGARTLAGALVPLVGTAPTNNNFAEADYNRETGLVGDGSTTNLDTNRAHNIDGQDDRHAAVWISAAATGGSDMYLGTVATNPTFIQRTGATTTGFLASGGNIGSRTTATGLAAVKRSSSSEIETYIGGSSSITASTSGAPASQNYFVFDRAAGSLGSDARIAFYSIGESLDLAALDARVTSLITAIGNAI